MANIAPVERRRKILKQFIDTSQLKGLEIGPYDRPIVLKEMGYIKYLDYFTKEELIEKAPNTIARVVDEVVDVDFVIRDSTIPEKVNEQFDYVVASHVIEHVPNVIQWLQDLASVLSDKGRIFLAVPDKRYTFDIMRPVTTTGKLIDAFRTNKTCPSFADVFDTARYHKKVKLAELWQKKCDVNKVPFSRDIHMCMQKARKAESTYVDCHCNVFTASSFQQIIGDLFELGLGSFEMETFQDVVKNTNEFVCILRKK